MTTNLYMHTLVSTTSVIVSTYVGITSPRNDKSKVKIYVKSVRSERETCRTNAILFIDLLLPTIGHEYTH